MTLMAMGDFCVNNQTLRHFEPIGGIRRDTPRWLNVLGFIAALVAISGSECNKRLDVYRGSSGSAVAVPTGTSLWTTNSPYGGQIRTIAIDPASSATVYAGGIGGVFKSTHGGLNWTPASYGIVRSSQNIIVNTVAISPACRCID